VAVRLPDAPSPGTLLALAVVTGLEVDVGGSGAAAPRAASAILDRVVSALAGEGASGWSGFLGPLRAVLDAILHAGGKTQGKSQPTGPDKPRASAPPAEDAAPAANDTDAEGGGTDTTTAAALAAAAFALDLSLRETKNSRRPEGGR
jgi:hypothetical protein